MSRPTEQIRWATDVLLDPVTGNINRAAPSVQSTFSGLLRRRTARPTIIQLSHLVNLNI